MKTKSFFSILLVAGFLSVTVTSCKKDEVAVSSVSLDQKTYALAEGGQFVLTPTILPADAANKNVTWESSNAGVASVSGGVVNGVSAGTATITVKTVDGGKTDNCVVTVTKDVTGVTIAPSPASVPIGEEITLTASIEPAGASDQTVTWSKGDGEGDVTIAPSGLTCKVTGVTAGNIEVVVTTGNGKTAKCIVTVTSGAISVESVDLDIDAQPLPRGETFTLTATINPAEATNKTVTWSQSGDGEVELEPDGLSCKVTGVAVGTVTITVTTEDGEETATCEVEVIAIGADFSESAVKVYNFAGANKPADLYPGINAFRFADMDLERVLISGRLNQWGAGVREEMGKPRIFNLNDLKTGVASPQSLDDTDVWGGNGGEIHSVTRLAHGHAYACRLHTDVRIYDMGIWHWSDLNGTAELLVEFKLPESEVYDLGDQMSVEIDESGNGYIFLMGWGHAFVVRVTVANFDQIDESSVAILTPGVTPAPISEGEINEDAEPGLQTYHQVDGSADEYIYTSSYEPVRLVDADGNKLYTMTSFANTDGCAARIIKFNDARYLAVMNDTYVGEEGVIAVYDISKGATTTEALQNFDNRSATDKAPVYTFSLEGPMLGGYRNDGAVSIDFAKDVDKLYIVGSAQGIGFAVIEFPIAE